MGHKALLSERIGNVFRIGKEKLNLDSTVYLSIISKAWSVIKTPLSVILITKFLSPAYQGYWYTFLSMAALTVLAELGFTTIIIQYVSHEFAHLHMNDDNTVNGDDDKLEKFFALIKFCISRYLIIIPLGIIIVLLIGFIFFKETLYSSNLNTVWIIYAISGGLMLFTSLLSSIIQGINKVKHVLQINMYSNIASTLSIWIVLIAGGGIWALTISSLMFCVISFMFFYRGYKKLFVQIYSRKISEKFNWGKEVYNLQLQYSISWIAGYFIFNFVTPVTLYFMGPVMAGKVGITFTSTSAILQMAYSWVANKIPEINMHISRDDKKTAKSRFSSLNKSSLTFFVLCSLMLVAVLQLNFFNLQVKFLPVWLTLIILVAEFSKLLFGNWAVYLRAYKTEPYLFLSVLNGFLTLVIFLVCLYFFKSFTTAILLFSILQVVILFPASKKYLKN